MKKNRDNDSTTSDADTDTSGESEILARLGERVEKAVAMIQDLRREREQLRARVDELESRLRDHDDTSTRLESLEEEHDRFKRERGEVRDRIESILSSLEALEES
ncbi:MAG: cell division protein ZapB [Acidobacteria bacterium]|nr:cell division protein ZapB [Acidobacteriota bacterium]MBV9478657.1 cell division protein ZapB [Acidobacteriota bacterium]